jgi:hypothetical protein
MRPICTVARSVTDRRTDRQTDRQTDCILRRRRQQLCEQLVKFPNLTPLVKMGSPYSHYFPTCHPSAIMDSATLSADALSVAVIDMQIAS